MSTEDYLRDTPVIARPFCPVCESDIDHAGEILDVRYCHMHTPTSNGVADSAVTMADTYPAGSSEAGGIDNRAWCELLHRKRLLKIQT